MTKPTITETPSIYRPATLEFATVAREYCILLDNATKYTCADFLRVSVRMFALLYLKASLLPECDYDEAGWQPDIVDEAEYERIRQLVSQRLGRWDDYLEVFHEEFAHSDGPVCASISEDMADVYQDIRNFCEGYHSGDDRAMGNALHTLVENFRSYWGQRLCNGLRAMNQALYNGEDLDIQEAANANQDPNGNQLPESKAPAGAGVNDQPYFLGKMGMRLTGGKS